MITKEDAVAISNGDIEWHVVVAKAHAVRCREAMKNDDTDETRLSFNEWFRFLNSLSASAKWDAYSAFANTVK